MLSLIPRSWLIGAAISAFLMANGWTAYKVHSLTTRNLTAYYEKKIAKKETIILELHNTIKEINLRMSEQNEELTQARQADEDIKPVAGSKSDERLRVLSNDPACRNCK